MDADILTVPILGKDAIRCGFHLVPYIAHTVATTIPASTYVLITDTNVAALHLESFSKEFIAQIPASARFLSLAIPPGEQTKSREGKAHVEDFLLANKCTRDTVILALGGGVIGDLVGFVAATFMRGVRFVQIPTTLLAMVDSSVGGKTAIDTPHGKNLIGAFWQPEYIFIDAAFLETLPPREFSNGMAEVVKTAAIWNEDEFLSLESHASEIFTAIQTPSSNHAGRTAATRSEAQSLLLSVIVGSISVKAHIVTVDERETGLRNLVNFGHTIGHAIEAVLTPTILHGECVSVGMILEAEIARQLGILSQVAVGRLTRTLKSYNLPVSLSDPRIASLPQAKLLSVERLLDIMKIDKKNSGPQKKIVLLDRIGKTYEEKASVVKDEIIYKTLAEAARVIPGIPTKDPVRMATPGSKSISNRVLVLAALGSGTCRLRNLLHSDDTQVMMAALNDLKGAQFSWEDGGDTLVVQGGRGQLSVPPKGKELYLGNAGTAARFLTTVCTLVRSENVSAETTVITGNARMKQRPIGPLVTALRANGNQIEYRESEGCLPLAIAPQGLKGGVIQLAASVSSQYVSSILLCAPYAREQVVLELVGGQVISQPYIDMTIAMMRSFGIEVVRRKDPNTGALLDVYDIPRGVYKNPASYDIESDASSATYPLAIAGITGTTCTIPNIGSASLQGDAKFAKEILEKMGCVVVQTETETKVTGPKKGGLKAIEEVDMTEMTDAFLTATVLAAVAKGRTRILGVANQRVKECNRIRAMIDELAKFGVETVELDDGLEIVGKPIEELKQGVSVHCYDDHRVAMAFSVLSTVVANTIIEEKRCVEKTWPNWWDDLQNKIGIQVEGVELDAHDSTSSSTPSSVPQRTTGPSVVLIGMRGTGKSYIGSIAASATSWPLVDADVYFEEKYPIGVKAFVQEKGWEAFREAETGILSELLDKKGKGHIISLGGGIVETPGAREVLKAYKARGGPVVHVVRPLSQIIAYLDSESARPAYGEPIGDVFRRREAWYAECSSHVFDNNFGLDEKEQARKASKAEAARYFRHVSGVEPNLARNVGGVDSRSYFLSLTFPDVTAALHKMDALTEGADAVELRVDLLRSPKDYESVVGQTIPDVKYVQEQLSALRRATGLPIVYTVRTKSQGGAFPDEAKEDAKRLLKLGLQMGVEYLDVETTLPKDTILELVKGKGHSKIVASWHDWSGNFKWDGQEVKAKYDEASRWGDIVKIVGKATSLKDNFALVEFSQGTKEIDPNAKPLIAINMGVEGQLSRILNPTLSPVSHPLLPNKAAPGQLSFKEIQQALHLVGLSPTRRFYLFGNPIQKSMSPTLHNTGFEVLGLPHRYELLETQTVGDEIKIAVTAPDFGGASVTIPFKLDVIPLLDKLTEAAETMGAVNTVIPRKTSEGKTILVGDNTDWLGIRGCVLDRLGASVDGANEIKAALVIGAGGTARAAIYALQSLGAGKIYLFNRTTSKAKELAEVFGDARIEVVDRLGGWTSEAGVSPPSVIVSTVPGSATTSAYEAEVEEGREVSGKVVLPASLLERLEGGVVVDMAYRPAETPLLRLASKVSNATRWKVVPGLEVLLEQGYQQFELWTGRKCPRHVVKDVVWAKYNASE